MTNRERIEFEWDDAKDAANSAKHGFGFTQASTVFEDPNRFTEESTKSGLEELRLKAVGRVGDSIVAVIDTVRRGRYRLISARKARRNERRDYDRRAARTGRDDGPGDA